MNVVSNFQAGRHIAAPVVDAVRRTGTTYYLVDVAR